MLPFTANGQPFIDIPYMFTGKIYDCTHARRFARMTSIPSSQAFLPYFHDIPDRDCVINFICWVKDIRLCGK